MPHHCLSSRGPSQSAYHLYPHHAFPTRIAHNITASGNLARRLRRQDASHGGKNTVTGADRRRRQGEWGKDMERKGLAVCIVVGLLGLLATVLGFAAEFKRIKVSDVETKNPGECVYPRSPALALGLAAAMALVMAQSIINTVAGCVCCKKRPQPSGSKWTLALISFVACWLAFILAFLLLLTGAALNDQRGEERMYFGNYCYVVRPGVFSGGAILSFTCVAFGIFYYVAVSSSKHVDITGQQVIVMGQPQIPPQSTQPVFVHEDTYNRQQFP